MAAAPPRWDDGGVSTASGPGPEGTRPATPRPELAGTVPGPPAKPPRSALTVRDLLGAVVMLAAVVLVIGGLTRGCAFAPTGPAVDPAAGPTVDAPAQLRALAPGTAFPLRVPAVPPGWRANSVSAAPVGSAGNRAVTTGYVTPDGRFLRLVQSDADEPTLLATEAQGQAVASGPREVAGTTWVTYTDDTREPIRVAERDGVRLLITGSGSVPEFTALATAVAAGEVLPR
jgi:hypothetical protein